MVEAAREELAGLIEDAGFLKAASHWQLWYELAPLEYREYLKRVTGFDTLRRELRTAIDRAEHDDWEKRDPRPLMELGPEVMRFVEIFDREAFTPDPEGYRAYVETVCPAILTKAARDAAHSDMEGHFPERDRALHTHILGGRNAGKSELMKLLIHHYVKHPELGSVVVIDPHGDLSRQISRWREFEADPDRLVYLDGTLSDDHFPALNPLAVEGLTERGRAEFADLMGDAIGSLSSTRELTDNMRNLARNCLRIALDTDRPSLAQVVQLLNHEANPAGGALWDLACEHPDLGEWFRYDFTAKSLSASKAGLADRLNNVLQQFHLGPMLKSPTALPLEDFCNAGKVVLVSLPKASGGDELGRLMLARVAMIGWRRASNPNLKRTPVHVFVDEAQRMIGPTLLDIMNELRKFGMRLTLAHQSLSQVEVPGQRDTLWNGAGVKIIGATDEQDVRARLFGREPPKIPLYQFAIRWGLKGDSPPVILSKPHSHLHGDRNDMDAAPYSALLERQIASYYTRRNRRQATPPARSLDAARDGLGELL